MLLSLEEKSSGCFIFVSILDQEMDLVRDLQHLSQQSQFCKTLNHPSEIDGATFLGRDSRDLIRIFWRSVGKFP